MDIDSESAAKQYEIIQAIGRRILSGTWAPGARIPPMSQLRLEFGVAIATMQRAMDQLQQGGFLSAHRGRGTFVNPDAACLHQLAMVFPAARGAHNWSLLYEALLRSSETHQGHTFRHYFNLGGKPDTAELARLERDVETFRVGGIFFAVNPFELAGSPVLAETLALPRLAVMSSSASYREIMSIYPELESFADCARDHIVASGLHKVAVLTTVHYQHPILTRIRDVLSPHDITVPDKWVQGLQWQDPLWARNCILNFFDLQAAEHPEAILITDDHLVAGVIAGLDAVGKVPGRDVAVVAYINVPSPNPMVPGVVYIGADIPALLEHGVMMLENRRLGRPCARCVNMRCVFFDTATAETR